MSYVSRIFPTDKRAMAQVDALLAQEGISRDKNLDYTCGIYDEDFRVIATGSCFGNTLRCFAVDHSHQGEGLLNEIISHLIDYQAGRGNIRLFLYTKPGTAKFFGDLGFYEIARVPDRLVFMENRRDGFSAYLSALEKDKKDGVSAAIVMNANPFTLGHQYLAEQAAAQCDALHLFVVSEDASLIPAAVRKRLVREGVGHLPNVILHDCGPYMISSATFPSYFLKDSDTVIESQARLDVQIFLRIAETLGITARYVGEEPTSQVTGLYNRVMADTLPRAGIACHILPRKALEGRPISASTVRQAIKAGDGALLRALVPQTTWDWLQSPEAAPVIQRIKGESDVVHY
ncbi:MAG: [Clostridia bacterium]|nr:[citrate (pro-3S)-lyase] ligase [Clostridia bacterium]